MFPTILKYLRNIGKLDPIQKEAILNKIKTFYNEIITKKTGNFWNLPEFSGSIQSTAFVAKFLRTANEWIEIDVKHISDALGFLADKMNANGKFEEESEYQNLDDVTLTAFVTISMLENQRFSERFTASSEKSLKFIEERFNKSLNYHALAISTYALSLSNPELAEKFLEKLTRKAKDEILFLNDAKPKEIEAASYAILAHTNLGKSVEATEIMNWLVVQHNKGGSDSTIDEFVLFQAAAEIAKHLYNSDFNLHLTLTGGNNKFENINIDNRNKNSEQNIIIESNEGVSVQSEGTGVAFIKAKQFYVVKSESFLETFNATAGGNQDFFNMKACLAPSTEKPQKRCNKYFWALPNFVCDRVFNPAINRVSSLFSSTKYS